MNNEIKYIVDNFDKFKIGADESFTFHCTQCGKCCIDRDDILLTPYDVFRISKELGIPPEDTVSKYGETYVGQSSHIPLVRLKPLGAEKRCPLLKEDNKCTVHNAKPVICAMFPIGRCLRIPTDNLHTEELSTNRIEFILSKPHCGDNSEAHTVREWLGKFGIPVDDEFFIKWHSAILKTGSLLTRLENMLPQSAMQIIWSLTFSMLYINYSADEAFLPQFECNTEKLFSMLTTLCEKAEASEKDVRGA